MLNLIFKLLMLIVLGIIIISVAFFTYFFTGNNNNFPTENQQEQNKNWGNIDLTFENNPNLTSAQRNYQRAKEALGQRISWSEMNTLENYFSQSPHEITHQVLHEQEIFHNPNEYQTYMEAETIYRTGDAYLAR